MNEAPKAPSPVDVDPDIDHRPSADVPAKYMRVIEMDEGEKAIAVIRRHPIGLLGILLSGGITVAIVLGLSIVASAFFKDSTTVENFAISTASLTMILGVSLSIIILLSTLVRAYVYNNSVIIVTTDKVVQVLYRTIISRTIVQFSLGDVTDVTVVQNGLLSRSFDFGTITIETAGEQEECVMNFVPYPHGCSKSIMAAHEENIHRYGN